MSTIPPTTFVATTPVVSALVDCLFNLAVHTPVLYVDLEGVRLSRLGSLSILTLLVQSNQHQKHAYLADVHTLGDSAFNTAGQSGKTLKAILQDPAITKVFFNVRNDSDALYAHYGIALQGVEDVQLMENAARTYRDRQYLCGLSKCIERDAPLSRRTKAEWQAVKSSGERLFSPDRGGSYAVFNTRPLSEELKAYCIGDVQHLPLLRNTYWPRLTAAWRQRLLVETRRRVSDSHMPNYRPHGLEKKFGPWPDERG